MNIKYITDILCFLVAIKENKAFYAKHKTELNHYIKILKSEIEHHNNRKTFKLAVFKQYIPAIFNIFNEFFNSE